MGRGSIDRQNGLPQKRGKGQKAGRGDDVHHLPDGCRRDRGDDRNEMGNRKRASPIQGHPAEPGQDKGKGKACPAKHGNDEQHRLFTVPDRSRRPECDAAAGEDNI